MIGSNGNDVLIGDDTADLLVGNGGNDVLDGGTGNDTLSGGAGSDQYWFGHGYGNDTIIANAYNNKDAIVFGNDIDPQDLNFAVRGSNLLIGLDNESLTVNGWFSGTANQVNQFQFGEDGNDETYRIGNDTGNSIVGTAITERIYGLGGNDTINGGAGSDRIYGGDGNDRIYYDANDSLIDGGSGSDTLDASRLTQGQRLSINDFVEIENLAGGSGKDTLTGDATENSLVSNGGDDLLTGGAGNDTLSGGAGNDSYRFNRGDGNDIILANSYNSKDTIVFGGDIDPQDLNFAVSDSNLVIGIGNESLTVNGWFSSASNQVNKFRFGEDGNIETYRIGNDTGNSIVGTAIAERIYGLGGNDTINGVAGSDRIYGGDGNDRIYYDANDSLIDGGSGSDTLDASRLTQGQRLSINDFVEIENLAGGSGKDTLTGDATENILVGNGGDDLLTGGAGNDTLSGGAGNDSYRFNRGDGNDVILANSYNSKDTIVFGGEVKPQDLEFTVNGSNLMIGIGNESLTVNGWFSSASNQVNQFQFGEDGNDETYRIGNDTGNSIVGTVLSERIYGLGGNDTLNGGAGDDVIAGGDGNDRISGGIGSDQFVYGSRSFGNDILLDFEEGKDQICFTWDGSETSAYTISVNGKDLLLQDDGGGILRITNAVGSGNNEITGFLFGANEWSIVWYDGNYYWNDLVPRSYVISGDTVIEGETLQFTVSRGGYVADNASVDFTTMDGTAVVGNDYAAQTGTLTFAAGETSKTITIATTEDSVIEDSESMSITLSNATNGGTIADDSAIGTITDDDFSFAISDTSVVEGNDLVFTVTRTGDLSSEVSVDFATANGTAVAGNDYMAQSGMLTFATGEKSKTISITTVDDSLVEGNETLTINLSNVSNGGTLADSNAVGTISDNEFGIVGNSMSESLSGTLNGDVLSGLEGDDTLYGLGGNDSLDGGSGIDVLYGGAGNDTIAYDLDYCIVDGGAGFDIITADQVLIGVNIELNSYSSIEAVQGSAYNDELTGYDGNNLLVGGMGNDTLDGAVGSDTLDGGVGNDLIYYDAGDLIGNIAGGAGSDTISAAKTVSAVTIDLGLYIDIENLVGSVAGDKLTGDEGTNIISGGSGDDTIDGGLESDILDAGAGNDIIIYDPNDLPGSVKGGDGEDILDASMFDGYVEIDLSTQYPDIEVVKGSQGSNNITGNTKNNLIMGGSGTSLGVSSNYGSIRTIVKRLIAGELQDDAYIQSLADKSYAVGSVEWVESVVQKLEAIPLIGFGGQDGNDNLYGLEGNDTIFGYYGNDTLTGGVDDDVLIGGSDVNYLDGGEGNDILNNTYGWSGMLVGGAGNDTLTGYDSDTLLGEDGDDILIGGWFDFVDGGGGNDLLYGAYSMETLLGGQGNDTLDFGRSQTIPANVVDNYAGVGVDNGNDIITLVYEKEHYSFSRNNNDLVISSPQAGGEEIRILNWFLGTEYQVETVLFENGSSSLTGDRVTELAVDNGGIVATAEPDVLTGTSADKFGFGGDDNIYGLEGDDTIYGYGGSDSLEGDAGNDVLVGGSDVNYLDGGEGNDILNNTYGWSGMLIGGAGNDTLTGYDSDTLLGEDGDDILIGGWFDFVDGGGGNDLLYGAYSMETLLGGQGNDTLDFGRSQTIPANVVDNYAGVGVDNGNDIITLVYEKEHYSFSRNNNDLVISSPQAGGEEIRILNWFLGTEYQVETVLFENGSSSLTGDKVTELAQYAGGTGATAFSDILTGSSGDDNIYGLEGDDMIYGYGGSDSLEGDAGNDVLVGGSDVNYLDGGEGNDILNNTYGWLGMLVGGAGNDTLTGYDSDTLLGEDGDDILIGGWFDFVDGGGGNDLLYGAYSMETLLGGQGNDTLDFGRSQTIPANVVDNYAGIGVDNGNDIITLVYEKEHYSFSRNNNDLVISTPQAGGEEIRILNWFLGIEYQVEKILCGNETLFAEDITRLIQLNDTDIATEANDVLVGLGGDDYYSGLGGTDTIYGLDGDDTLLGGNDNDILAGGNGKDYLDGGDGNDRLIEWGIFDTLLGGSGDDTLEGWYYDTISGGTGNDSISSRGYCVIDGGDGDDALIVSAYDTVSGGLGNDVYDVKTGPLRKLLVETTADDTGTDLLLFETGSKTESDFYYSVDGSDLVLSYVESGVEAVRIAGWFISNEHQLASIQFADGAVFMGSQISNLALGNDINGATQAADLLTGGSSDDTLYGFSGNDTLDGNVGNDRLYGGAGNDLLNGGVGIDSIYGGAGNDQIIYDTADMLIDGGSGVDLLDASLIADNVSIDLTSDSRFVSVENVSGGQSANYLVGNSSDNVLSGQANDDTLFGGAGKDSLQGNAGDDLLCGGDGDDVLTGSVGNDTLGGDTGNDLLDGGTGNDMYFFSGDWGYDTIVGDASSAGDQLRFNDRTAADISLVFTGNDLLITSNSGDTLLIDNWNSNADHIETVSFSDSTTTTLSDLLDIDEAGNSKDQAVLINTNQSKQGNINTGGDEDWYRFTASLAGTYEITSSISNGLYAYLYDGAGSLIAQDNNTDNDGNLAFSADLLSGNDYFVRLVYDDTVTTGSYDLWVTTPPDNITDSNDSNTVSGTAGVDIIRGELGADTLYGSQGNDSLCGGIGEDFLYGGAGDDTLISGNSTTVNQGNKYAMLVGISDYLSPSVPDLPYTLNDISDMEQFLNDNAEWTGTQIAELTDSQATETGILSALHNLAGEVSSGDQVLFYYSGHGMDQTGELCPYDINVTSDGIDPSELKAALQEVSDQIGDGHITVILDSCFSGQFVDAFAGSGNDYTVYSGAGNDEYGWEINSLENGLFSYYFVDWGLSGQMVDHNGDGEATTGETYGVVYQKIQRFVENYGLLGTHPQLADGSNDTYVLATYDQDYLEGGTGNDLLYSYYDEDTLKGGSGADTLDGGQQADLLYGEDDNDWIIGDSGNDTLFGGSGNDVLDGGEGNDVLVFEEVFGTDSIISSALNSADCVEFGSQFTIENLLVSANGSDLDISDNAGNILTIEDWCLGDGYALNRFQIQTVWYNTDGHEWQLAPDDNNGKLPPY